MNDAFKATILVVDDEPANLGVLFEFLGQAGFRVLVAENGNSALIRAERAQPDIILLDIKLPDINGFEVYEQLKARNLIANTTVIFLSVISEAETIAKGLDLNAVDYITKPFQPLEVVARVKKHLTLQNLRQELEAKNIQLQHEINERKRAEAARAATQHLMQTTLDGMSDPVILIGMDYQVLWANQATREVYGSPDNLNNPPFCFQLSHGRDTPCDRSTCTCVLQEVQRQLKPVTVRHEHTLATGVKRYLEIVASPLFDPAGNLTGIVEATRDITDRLQIEKELRIHRDNLSNILETIQDGVYIVDQEYNIQYVNQTLQAEFGLEIGQKCYSYFHGRAEACPWCKNDEVFAGKTVRWEWYSPKNQKTYDLIDTPLQNPDGSIWKLEIFRDVTERIRANRAQAALASFEERQRFARDFHDSMTQSLDSLILSINSANFFLQNNRATELATSLDALNAAARQARQEMRLLLYELQLAPQKKIDLFEMLSTRLNMVEKRVGIATIIETEGLGAISAETETELFYIAMEALNNTLKHANATQVTIRILANPYEINMEIMDDGSGFVVNQHLKCGMGLTNMQARAANLNGSLTVESTPGEGTQVKVIIAR